MDPDNRVWKSYVWHEGKCWFVSTIERDYDTYEGPSRGQETMVWEWDWDANTRGKLVHQAGHIVDHQAICRCLINWGEIPDEFDERYCRFDGTGTQNQITSLTNQIAEAYQRGLRDGALLPAQLD